MYTRKIFESDSIVFSIVFSIRWGVVVCLFSQVVQAKIQEHELEQERLSGYKDHVVESQIYDRERMRSYRAYLESVEKDLFEKKHALKDFKKSQNKVRDDKDEQAAFAEFMKAKKQGEKEMDRAAAGYRKNQQRSKNVASRRDFTEEEELDVGNSSSFESNMIDDDSVKGLRLCEEALNNLSLT